MAILCQVATALVPVEIEILTQQTCQIQSRKCRGKCLTSSCQLYPEKKIFGIIQTLQKQQSYYTF